MPVQFYSGGTFNSYLVGSNARTKYVLFKAIAVAESHSLQPAGHTELERERLGLN